MSEVLLTTEEERELHRAARLFAAANDAYFGRPCCFFWLVALDGGQRAWHACLCDPTQIRLSPVEN